MLTHRLNMREPQTVAWNVNLRMLDGRGHALDAYDVAQDVVPTQWTNRNAPMPSVPGKASRPARRLTRMLTANP